MPISERVQPGLAMLLAELGKHDEAREVLAAQAADGFAARPDRNWPVSWFQLCRAAALVRDSLQQLTTHHNGLARHMEMSIHTGAWCTYEPEQPATWIL